MYHTICRMLKKPNLFFIVIYCFSILFPTKTHAFELLTNGFGTICASKSDLPKSAYMNVPVYPFLTTMVNGVSTGIPYVAPTFYRPSYMGAERRWNFLFDSKFGLQFTALLDEKFKAVVQIVGRGETMNDNHYTAKMDWAYVQYDRNNQMDFQFGRFRVPAFYYSAYLDVNHAQPWVTPPEEVYYIVGGAFRNMDGIKMRYTYFMDKWSLNTQAFYGSYEEQVNILFQPINVKVRNWEGIVAQLDNDNLTFRASVIRSTYDTSLYAPLQGLIFAANTFGVSQASTNLAAIANDKDQSIVYIGLAFAANFLDDFDFLFEQASTLSPGIISTARKGMYGSLTYSMNNSFAFTFTYGYTRPLQTEVNKFEKVQAFFNTPQYATIDKNSGAGNAVVEQFRSYLGSQRSYALDIRYDVIPSLAIKGSVKYLTPTQNGPGIKYLFGRVAVFKHIWVYRFSVDFVF